MGTNYYLVDKKKFQKEREINKILNENIKKEDIHSEIEDIILKHYRPILEILNEKEYSEITKDFASRLNNCINKLIADLTYDVDYAFNITKSGGKHIGKSSIGWLFSFQYQDEWHSYDEFKSFILDKEKMKDKVIIDEYNKEISPEELLDWIDTKQSDKYNLDNPDNFRYDDNVNGYRFSSGDFS